MVAGRERCTRRLDTAASSNRGLPPSLLGLLHFNRLDWIAVAGGLLSIDVARTRVSVGRAVQPGHEDDIVAATIALLSFTTAANGRAWSADKS